MEFIFAKCKTFLFRPRVFLALSAAGPAGGTPVHHGASVGPGRAPWRVLWAFKEFKVTKSGKEPWDRVSPS